MNELRDGATQIEEEIDKTRDSLHDNKVDVARLKGKLDRLDNKDPSYVSMNTGWTRPTDKQGILMNTGFNLLITCL